MCIHPGTFTDALVDTRIKALLSPNIWLSSTDDISHCFKVLRNCRGNFDRLIYEMWYIGEIKACFNVQSDSLWGKLFIWICSFQYNIVYFILNWFVLVLYLFEFVILSSINRPGSNTWKWRELSSKHRLCVFNFLIKIYLSQTFVSKVENFLSAKASRHPRPSPKKNFQLRKIL